MDHAHPCGFRLHRRFDRGWGEMAFEYRWDSTSGLKAADGVGNPDLDHCSLYERTTYAGNAGAYADGWYLPPEPPFVGWRFRDPTDGRTGPVGLECFPASQGWAWDRHKVGGRLVVPTDPALLNHIFARQEYRFVCDLCGLDAPVPGPDAGPHPVLRAFGHHHGGVWRYAFVKHGATAWMDVDARGYVDDSAHIGFGPWEANEPS